MRLVKIDRQMWLRGHHDPKGKSHISYLWYVLSNCGCCLGHAILQTTGCLIDELNDLGTPRQVLSLENNKDFCSIITSKATNSSFVGNSDFVCSAIGINDDHSMTDEERETKLRFLFKENGFELEFFN